jgi:hypothetical protein
LRLHDGDITAIRTVMGAVAYEPLVTYRREQMAATVLRRRARLRQVRLELTGVKSLLLVNARNQLFLVAPRRETSAVHKPGKIMNEFAH